MYSEMGPDVLQTFLFASSGSVPYMYSSYWLNRLSWAEEEKLKGEKGGIQKFGWRDTVILFGNTILLTSSCLLRKYREALEIHKHQENLNKDNGLTITPLWQIILSVFFFNLTGHSNFLISCLSSPLIFLSSS